MDNFKYLKYIGLIVACLLVIAAIMILTPQYNVYVAQSRLEIVRLQAKSNQALRESMIVNLNMCAKQQDAPSEETINIIN